jgi:dimethylglycine dehydrogenase
LRRSPIHDDLAAQGAQFGVRGGWERALWYDARAGSPALTFRRDRAWMPAVCQEVHAVRHGVGLMDLPGFSRFMITGRNAEGYLDRLVCSRLPRLGRVSLAYVLNADGGIVSEFTLTRLGPQEFYAISAAIAEHHDDDVLTGALPTNGSVEIARVSEQTGTLILAGPRAREVLSQITATNLSNEAFPWLSAQNIHIGEARVLALRVNYVGELGWELHVPVEHLPGVYRAVVGAGGPHGLRHFGMYAMDSLRIDKCYRGWKSDLETGYSPFEASLDRFVDLTKTDFPGKQALQRQRSQGVPRRFVPLILDQPGSADAPYCSSVFAGDQAAGLVTSGVWSHTLERSVALAYVSSNCAAEGNKLAIDIFGERCAATVGREPLFDPTNLRCRS